jgi:hypothetical protein
MTHTTNLGTSTPVQDRGKSLRIPIEGTSISKLRLLAAAPHVKRQVPLSMSANARTFSEVMKDLHAVVELLDVAEQAWPEALRVKLAGSGVPELSELEELLHCATHETASSLAFLVHDIEALLARVEVRKKFALFTHEQFDRIVLQGWSLSLVQDLHSELPSSSLSELSGQVSRLCLEWEGLPSVSRAKRGT